MVLHSRKSRQFPNFSYLLPHAVILGDGSINYRGGLPLPTLVARLEFVYNFYVYCTNTKVEFKFDRPYTGIWIWRYKNCSYKLSMMNDEFYIEDTESFCGLQDESQAVAKWLEKNEDGWNWKDRLWFVIMDSCFLRSMHMNFNRS